MRSANKIKSSHRSDGPASRRKRRRKRGCIVIRHRPWNPAVFGRGEVTSRNGCRAYVKPVGSGRWCFEVKPVGYEVIDPKRAIGAGIAKSKRAAKLAAARLMRNGSAS